jgi:chromosome segregation ATPase
LIEYLMLFTLGACCAGLIWLAIWPALSRRTERLARRRIEATLPMTVAEFAGERDQLRAVLAVKEARLEKREDALATEHAQVLSEAGRREARITALEEKLTQEIERHGETAAELARANEALSELRTALEAGQQDHSTAREQLATVEGAHRDLREAHEALSDTAERHRLEAATLQAEREALLGRLEGLDAAHRALRVDHGSLATTADTRHVEVAGLKAERQTLLERLARFEQAVAGKDVRLAEFVDLVRRRGAEKPGAEPRASNAAMKLAASDAHGARLQLDLEEANNRLAALTSLRQAAGQEEAEAVAEIARLRRELDIERARADRDIEAEKREFAKMEADLQDMARAVDGQRAELRIANASLDSLQAERDSLRAELARLAARPPETLPDGLKARQHLVAMIEKLADDIALATGTGPLPPVTEPEFAPAPARQTAAE